MSCPSNANLCIRAGLEVFEQSRPGGFPREQFAGEVARAGHCLPEETADKSEVTIGVFRSDRHDRNAKGASDSLGDGPGGDCLLCDSMQARSSRCLLEPQPDEPGGVGTVHRGPCVGAVADVAGHTLLACSGHQKIDETPVPGTVDRRSEPGDDGPHTAADVVQGEVLGAATVRIRAYGWGRVRLQHRPSLNQTGNAVRDYEWPAGTDQRFGEGLDGGPLGAIGLRWISPIMLVRQVNDAIRLGCSAAKGVEVIEVSAQDCCPLPLERRRRDVRPRQSNDLVSRS